tara:strand:- start:749 stop:937 length:189 start_codon:yes stop_codon:yes gene_type:complete
MIASPVLPRISLNLCKAFHDLKILTEDLQRSHALIELEVCSEPLWTPLIHDYTIGDIEIGCP